MKLAHRVVGILYLLRVSDGGQSEVCEEQGQGGCTQGKGVSIVMRARPTVRWVGVAGRKNDEEPGRTPSSSIPSPPNSFRFKSELQLGRPRRFSLIRSSPSLSYFSLLIVFLKACYSHALSIYSQRSRLLPTLSFFSKEFVLRNTS